MATCSSRHRTVARKLEDLRTRESQEGTVRGGWVLGYPHKAHLPPGTRSPASPLPAARQHAPLARRRRVRQRWEGGSGCDALSVLPVSSPSASCPLPRWRRRCPARSAGWVGGSCSCGACLVRGDRAGERGGSASTAWAGGGADKAVVAAREQGEVKGTGAEPPACRAFT